MSNTQRHDYQVGQVWAYTTRPGEEQSRLYIAKVETLGDGGPIFHVCIDGVGIPNARLAGGVQTELPHAPVSVQTLDASVTTLIGSTDTPPDVAEGYAAWREAYDAGHAGVFTITVAEIVDAIDQIVRQQVE